MATISHDINCAIACGAPLLLQYVWGQDVDRFLKLGNFLYYLQECVYK